MDKKVKESFGVNPWIEPYEISHDYMIDMFEKICRNKLSLDIRNNIDYYHVNQLFLYALSMQLH